MANLKNLYSKALKQKKLSLADAMEILSLPDSILPELFNYTGQLRQKYFANKIQLCSIVNAKSGKCSEDCSYCAQSAQHTTQINSYPLLTKEKLLEAYASAKNNEANCFSLVTSGKALLKDSELKVVCETLTCMSGLTRAASLGILDKIQLLKLKQAGLDKYHHNLETSASFFPKMCSTHTYEDRIKTIQSAKEAGLQVCSGVIFGIGETPRQRAEAALELRQLNVDSVPINILHPIPGTRVFGKVAPLQVVDILKIIAMFRFVLPNKTIGVIGGREVNLGDRQAEIFSAGANGIMIGNYLTTGGNPVQTDLQMIKACGLEVKTTQCHAEPDEA
ncbi:MAG: biotin synthase BioB [Candidatus Margulisbacteria bacterium]|nr:biotin synthase BioB [Candidatus Margulisiibacteriota bacterium]